MTAFAATCTQCGTPLDSRALNGLCPRCVALDFFAPAPRLKTSPDAPLFSEGERRIGDYELIEEIARGGMGVVYRARQVSLGREVAVKMLLQGVLAGDNAIARFKAEASAVANLQHPNIVAIHEIGEHQGQHFFSMEFVAGVTLADKVRDGPLPAKAAAIYLERVAAAVHYAHEHGVLHRDLKPSNVLVDGQDHPRVTDFGLAKCAGGQTDLTMTGQVVGTPAYMPPEQAGGARFGAVDARSDVYSLGAVLYHLVTGRAPFTGETITEILHQVTDTGPVAPRLLNPQLPRDLETICLKCLAKEPSGRYASAQALAQDLNRFLQGEPIAARSAGAAEKLWRWSRRKPALATALGACIAIFMAGITGILWQLKQTKAAQTVAVQKAKDEETQRKAAEQSELVMRQNLYAADMMGAQRALDRNDLGTARLLLNGHRPRPGQEDLRGFEWRYLWQRAQGDKCLVLTNAGGPVQALALSPDGKWLAFAGEQVVLWDLAKARVRAQARVVSESIAFTPDSSTLLLADWDASVIRRWDWQKNAEPMEFARVQGSRPRITISPLGNTFAVGCGNDIGTDSEGTTTLYDVATGRPRQTLAESGGVPAFSPDGTRLATGAWKSKLKLWNPSSGELVREFTNATLVADLSFSLDGKMLAVCSAQSNDSTWLYDVATGAQRSMANGLPCVAYGAAISPDETTLATAVTDATVRLWDIKSGGQTACLLGHSYSATQVLWTPDGTLASAAKDGTVRLWDIAGRKAEDESITGRVKPGYFSRDGRRVAVEEPDGTLSVRELPSLRRVGVSHRAGKYLGFSADDSALLTIQWSNNTGAGTVVWWRLPDFAEQNSLSLPVSGGPLQPQQLSPDCRWLATPGSAGEVWVWDLSNHGQRQARLQVMQKTFADGLAFSPDGGELACSFSDAKVGYLWDLKTDHPAREIPGLCNCIQFSRDGRTIFANGLAAVTFWDAASGRELGTTIGRWGGVNWLDLSPDGKTLVFPTNLGVRLWNVATRREAGLITVPAYTSSVAFAPEGNRLFITELGPQGPFTIVRHAPSFAETDQNP